MFIYLYRTLANVGYSTLASLWILLWKEWLIGYFIFYWSGYKSSTRVIRFDVYGVQRMVLNPPITYLGLAIEDNAV